MAVVPDNETINFSLWNNGGNIISGNDFGLWASDIRNTQGDIIAYNNLDFIGNSLINERIGFYTEIIPEFQEYLEYRYNADTGFGQIENHYYTYWIDRAGAGREAYLAGGGKTNLEIKDIHNKASLIESGDSLSIKGNNFINEQVILQSTQEDRWRRGGTRPKWREVYRNKSVDNVQSGLFVADSADLKLNNSFQNSGLVEVGGTLTINAPDIINGITDPNAKTPPVKELPNKLVLPLAVSQSTAKEIYARELKSVLFNEFRISRLNDEWRPVEIWKWLEENAKKAQEEDESLVEYKALTESQIANLTEPIIWPEKDSEGNLKYAIYFPLDWQNGNTSPNGSLIAENISLTGDRVFNTGDIEADEKLEVDAKEIINEKRKVNAVEYVKVYGGLFGPASSFEGVEYHELQTGGNMSGKEISLNASEKFINKGGTVIAEESLEITAPTIINEVAEGERVVTWDPGSLGKLLGMNTYDLACVYEAGTLFSGGLITLSGDRVINRGSDIIAIGDINITAKELIEQDWVASHHTTNDSASFGFFSVQRDKETEHVTRGSQINSLMGDVNLNTQGTFRNRASDVVAGNNINIQANNIEITDAVEQSENIHGEGGFESSGAQIGWSYNQTTSTQTTHQGSNLVAGNNLNISAKQNINITGSNLIAGNDLELTGENINIQNGLYTDTINTTGIQLYTRLGAGSITGGVQGFDSNSSMQTLTPSNLIGNNITINCSNSVNFKASTASANDTLAINTNNLNISGEYQTANTETKSGGVSVTYIPPNMASVGVNAGYAYSNEGQYFSSSLSALNLSLNAPNQTIDGAVINGQEINPHDDYSESHSFSVSLSGGTAGFGGGVGVDDFSLFGGVGSNNSVGLGYKEFSIGTGFGQNKDGSTSNSIFGSAYGLGIAGSRTNNIPGITNDHPVYSLGGSYGLLALGGDFQHWEIKNVNGMFGLWGFNHQINAWDEVCFEKDAPIQTKDGIKNIQDIQVGDLVSSWNEEKNTFEWKRVLKTFIRVADSTLHIKLSNGEIMKVTPEHIILVNGIWQKAKNIKIDDKLFSPINEQIEVLKVEIINKKATVYNFEVEDNHTYIAYGAVVHNKCSVRTKDGKILLVSDKEFVELIKDGKDPEFLGTDTGKPKPNNPNNPINKAFEAAEDGIITDFSYTPAQFVEFIQSEDGFKAMQNNNKMKQIISDHFKWMILGYGARLVISESISIFKQIVTGGGNQGFCMSLKNMIKRA